MIAQKKQTVITYILSRKFQKMLPEKKISSLISEYCKDCKSKHCETCQVQANIVRYQEQCNA